ncbi:MAG: Tim44 domain-containing protein [Proteobacteria bacterium]|nr:Tim44 domain-containing protein [Pseudomonadota bacterium]
MSPAVIQLLVLAAIAVFLIMRLKGVLGTRDGFEPKVDRPETASKPNKPSFEVIEGGLDRDIIDHVEMDSRAGQAFAKMKKIEPSFSVGEFLDGARQAYEMILMAFESDDLDTLKKFLSDDVYDSFASVIADRQKAGLKVNATFVGVREMKITGAKFNGRSKDGEITMRFVGEVVSYVEDAKGKIIEGNRDVIKRQVDTWSFGRKFGSDDPNWALVATGG